MLSKLFPLSCTVVPSEEVDERAVEVEHGGAGVDPVLVVLARRQRVREPRLRVGRHVGLDQLGDPLRRFVACIGCIEYTLQGDHSAW